MPALTPRRLFGCALAAWAIVVGLGLVLGAPLTGDESAYALLARGVDVDWLYRPRGVVALARIGVALGGSDVAMRLVSAVTSLGFVAAIAAVGRRAFGPWVGAWSAVLVVGTHAFVMRAPELLGDLPAATCLLAAVAVLLGELPRPRLRYRVVAAAPALAAAFYFKYGSAPVIAMIVLAVAVAWGRSIAARPGPALVFLVVLGALLAPFALASDAQTGSVLGILELSREVAGRGGMASGLRVFVLGDPFVTYGALLPPVMVAGLVALLRPPPARRIAWVLGALAIGQIIVIGLVGQGPGNARYIFFAIALLVVLGVDGITRALAARPHLVPRAPRIAGVLAALAWLSLVVAEPITQHNYRATLRDVLADASAIRADADGRPCVVAALAVPELMWYSGCDGARLPPSGVVALAPERRWYVASTPRRPVDPAVLARAEHAEPVPLVAPSAWYLRRP